MDEDTKDGRVVVNATGEDISEELMEVITEGLIKAGVLIRRADGSLFPSNPDDEGGSVQIWVDDEGELEDAKKLEDWEFDPKRH